MTQLRVLMYHAITDFADAAGGADPHYTVAKSRFREHLRLMRARDLRLCSVRAIVQKQRSADDVSCVALTFDDGHVSNIDAVGEIAQQEGQADFFVNPSTIGRTNYLTWADLRAMAAQGMSIQSHGYTHRYLDELAATEVEYELSASKKELEDKLGQEVILFAPPGGRMPRHFVGIARRAGYAAICSSRPGTWTPGTDREIARLAVLAATTDEQLHRWIAGAPFEIAAQRARYQALWAMKRLLGNRVYEQIRGGLLSRAR